MKKSFFLLAAIVTSFMMIAQNPNPSAAIDRKIANVMNTQNLPGVSTVIVKGGEIIWIESYGYANTDLKTPFTDTTSMMVASVSKIFTGVALMQLYESGLFSLDDDIDNYLPFKINIPNYESYPITFRMLLTHTSSITDADVIDNYYNWKGDPTISLADCIERYFNTTGADYNPDENFLSNQPGTVYEYSNIATALEGYLVEVISGMPFNQYCHQNIFKPLCMHNTHWYLSEYQNLNMLANPHDYLNSQYKPIDHYGFADYPDGMLHTNVRDAANFMITMLQNGRFHNDTMLNATTLNEMFTPQIPAIDNTQGLQFYKKKFNVSSGNISLWGHSGGEKGISTEMYFDQSNNMAIAVFANGENDASQILEILHDYGIPLSPSGIGIPNCNFILNIKPHDYSFLYNVYPNPASNKLIFEADNLNSTQHDIIITDILGCVLLQFNKIETTLAVDITGFSNGIYIYKITENNTIVRAGKFVVE